MADMKEPKRPEPAPTRDALAEKQETQDGQGTHEQNSDSGPNKSAKIESNAVTASVVSTDEVTEPQTKPRY